MKDDQFQTLCVMAAVLRTGKSGPTGKAWGSALEEAVAGYAMLLKNREAISKIAEFQVQAMPTPEDSDKEPVH